MVVIVHSSKIHSKSDRLHALVTNHSQVIGDFPKTINGLDTADGKAKLLDLIL